MEFKKFTSKPILVVMLILVLLVILVTLHKAFTKTDAPVPETPVTLPQLHVEQKKDVQVQAPVIDKQVVKNDTDPTVPEDLAIQEQLDRDRQQQKQTKDLKFKLEQTNLELEQEKALAEIGKLKKENMGAFNEPAVDGQTNLPEIDVEYIGGGPNQKEAILSIAGSTYQVKPKSNPIDSVQVVSITDSSVTLHFTAPQDLTKTFDFKPE